MVGYRLYEADPNAPWERTFEAVANLLTSFRSKGMDPYGENKSGPLLGHQAVGANLVAANAADVIDFFRYQLDPADSFYQYARPGCLYTS